MRELLESLLATAHSQLVALESAISISGTDISCADRERNVRSLRNLLKVIEEINLLHEKLERTKQHDNKPELDGKKRAELAKRIQALQGSA